jgi:hypothetical protein
LADATRQRTIPDRAGHLHCRCAFNQIIVTMLIALTLFHYWRWQDGRKREDQKPNTVNH